MGRTFIQNIGRCKAPNGPEGFLGDCECRTVRSERRIGGQVEAVFVGSGDRVGLLNFMWRKFGAVEVGCFQRVASSPSAQRIRSRFGFGWIEVLVLFDISFSFFVLGVHRGATCNKRPRGLCVHGLVANVFPHVHVLCLDGSRHVL